MDREEKALEQTLDVLIGKLNDSKVAIGTLIARLEDDGQTMDPVTWNNALDSYALISSQVNQVLRHLKPDTNPSVPNLKSRVVFPIFLNPERDEDLVNLTEGRVQSVNHDMVPNYLRTCPEPEIESKEQQILMKAANMGHDQGMKSVATTNGIVDRVSALIKNWGDGMESEGSGRITYPPTHNPQDTKMIIGAISNGTGLRGESKLIGPGPSAGPPVPPPGPAPAPAKAAKMIRTKITANTPYNR